MNMPVRPLSDFLRVCTAPAIWFSHLAVVYAAEALICTGPAASGTKSMIWAVVIATAVALIALVVFAAGLGKARLILLTGRTDRDGSQFLPVTALILTLLSMLAVIWTALPTILLPACASVG